MSAVQSCAPTMYHIAYFVLALVSRFVSYRDASSLSQFSSDLVRGVHARARREKRGVPLPSRPLAPSVTCVVICLSRAFCSRDQAKKRLLVVHIISASFESHSLKANLPRIPLQPQMLLFLDVVVSRQWIITVDNKTILL